MSMQSVAHFKFSFWSSFFKSWKSFQGLRCNVLMYAASPPEGIQHPLTSKWWWPGREDSVLLPHPHVVRHAGVCVLVLLNYASFLGKSSVVCRSCSADTESTSTPGCRSRILTSISLTCPILFYAKARLSCSPHLPTAPSALWFSSALKLQAYLLIIRSFLNLCTCSIPNYYLFWNHF